MTVATGFLLLQFSGEPLSRLDCDFGFLKKFPREIDTFLRGRDSTLNRVFVPLPVRVMRRSFDLQFAILGAISFFRLACQKNKCGSRL